jgi:beta-lactamase regulating signal transducer with metallopeptidase domain
MMAAIETWLRQPAAQAIAWALLQFVWQGALVGLLAAAALVALRRSASDVRYLVSSIALAVMLTLAIVTGAQKYQALAQGPLVAASDRGPAPEASQASDSSPLKSGTAHPPDAIRLSPALPLAARVASLRAEALMPALMLVWLAGVSVLSLRLLTGWLWVQRLRTRGIAAADESLRRTAMRLSRRLRIARAVRLFESSLVDVPTVIGFLRPVVLLPASALAGLTAQQLEAILAHELAHIRRHDYLVNLLQTLVETVLFYHPAVWWLSRRIRIERENCCDDLAVSLCGDPVAYATALADLETLRSSGPVPGRRVAMAATGGSLLHRVRRLLGAPTSHSGRGPAWLAGGAALILVGGITVGATDARVAPLPSARSIDAVLPAAPPRLPAGESPRVLAAEAPRVPAGEPPHMLAAEPQRVPPPPAPPAVPAAVPAAPAAPSAPSTSIRHEVNGANGNWMWSSNGDKLEVSYRGAFEFTDDDTDVRELSSGGWLKISDGKWLGRHSVEIRDSGGQLEHRYYVNASARPFEPEGRLWLQQNLPRFVRNTGVGAPQRVARLMKTGGAAAVLSEIGRVDSSYAKGLYFRELFKQALTPEQYRQAMEQASRELRSSDYELAQLLIAAAERLPNDEASRAAYFDAASAIGSDYEVRRVYATMLKRGPVASAVLGRILAKAKGISSDYELSELLLQIMAQQPLDESNRAPFFAAVNTIGSGYEQGRVLKAVIGKGGASPETLRAVLQASQKLSGYELSQLLQSIARTYTITGDLRDAYVAAAERLGDYEQGQVLAALVRSERRERREN